MLVAQMFTKLEIVEGSCVFNSIATRILIRTARIVIVVACG